MKLRSIAAAAVLALLVFGAFAAVRAQGPGYRISAPYSHKNLTIFLIHGKNETTKKNILTLQEAMERRIFVVYETSNVNELAVENLSKEFDVFIQSGDIVKGGKQDRVLAVSIIIPARSGRVLIQAYCVESGRWEKRKNEDKDRFSSSNDRVVTKDLKLAANGARSQQEVWAKVSEAQAKLSRNVGGAVNAPESESSLQLSLEDRKVRANIDDYIRNLTGIMNGKSDVVGYAFAINGHINSADIYVSNALFKKLWPKMLKSAAIEAVSESRSVRLADPVKADAVEEFLAEADRPAASRRPVGDGASVISREDDENAVFESRDERSKVTIHKSYVKKP